MLRPARRLAGEGRLGPTPPRRRSCAPIHPEYVAALLDESIADDAIVTVDTGMCNVWAARYPQPHRTAAGSSARSGTAPWPTPCRTPSAPPMPTPAAGRLDVRRRRLTMLLGELLTVAEHNLPIKVVGVQQRLSSA